MVEKDDFGAGSSSRSGRLLHCGLRYLEPGDGLAYMGRSGSPLWRYLRHPGELVTGVRKARDAMRCRAEFVRTMPERLPEKTYFYPVWSDSKYKPWEVGLAFRILGALGPGDVPLDYLRLRAVPLCAEPL